MILFHVTPAENLPSIEREGLRSQANNESSRPAIYFFKNLDDMEQAALGWLGDAFEEDDALAVLEIETG